MDVDDKKFIVETPRNAGIKMRVGGCGCCDSPWLFFEFNGRQVLAGYEAEELGKWPRETWPVAVTAQEQK